MISNGLPWWMPLSVFVWALQMVVFHAVGYGFEVCDRHAILRRAKVRDIDRLSYAQLLPRVLFNQVFVLLPCMIAVQAAGLCFAGQEHLPLWRFVLSLFAMGVGHDVVQYATHRYLLHRPSLNRVLRHSVHHSTGASKAISACFMSPQDFFLEIALPYLLPLALIGGGGSDIVFHSMIAGLGAVGGVYEHSGYDLAALLPKQAIAAYTPRWIKLVGGFITSHAHGEHHMRGNVSFSDGFGSPGVCDSVLGTRWNQIEPRRRQGGRRSADNDVSTEVAITPAE